MNGSISRLLARPWRIALAGLAASLVVAACGGGGGDGSGGVDTGGTGSFSAGPISGFGSVIVNGVRFDDSRASFSDDDDDAVSSSLLRLGMMVEIEGGHITVGTADTLGAGTADSIHVVSEIKGPVEAINSGTSTLTVLGQTVIVTNDTVFEDGFGFSAIATGQILEVYGFVQAGGRITATRIEREGANTGNFKLRGFIANLDAIGKTFTIGAARISYAGISNPPALANGSFVRVRLNTTQVAGTWTASRLEMRRPFENRENRDEAEVEGIITAYSGVGTNFELNGLPVNASAARFENGSTANLAVGVRVEVEGAVRNGVLVAREVEFQGNKQIRLFGTVGSFNAGDRSFVVRGVRVVFTASTRFDDGTASQLGGTNVEVEVRGRLRADGTTVEAERIRFED